MIINLLLQIYIAKSNIETDLTTFSKVVAIESFLVEIVLVIKLVQWII